jgi:hypothetical protein
LKQEKIQTDRLQEAEVEKQQQNGSDPAKDSDTTRENKENEKPDPGLLEIASEKKRRREKQAQNKDTLKDLSSKYKLDPIEKLKQESDKEIKMNSPRPDSGSSTLTTTTNNTSITTKARYPGSIVYGRDPVYGFMKKSKKRVSV